MIMNQRKLETRTRTRKLENNVSNLTRVSQMIPTLAHLLYNKILSTCVIRNPLRSSKDF